MKPRTIPWTLLFIAILLALHPFDVHVKANELDLHFINYSAPTNIYVRFWHLTESGSKAIPETQCVSGQDRYGCVAYSASGYYYPYNTNPALVSIENDYLLDVVHREMDPRLYHPMAVKAQAIAARSYAYYWNFKGWNLGNDSNYQVFVPYTFEQWLNFNTPNNLTLPCQSTNLNQEQKIICNAVSSRHYISYYGDEPAQAAFTSDVYNATITNGGAEYSPYQHSVQDPISTACDANNFGPLIGMSQEGASRWARGEECSYNSAPVIPPNSGGKIWSVRWQDASQIIAHYYTGVHLRNADAGNALLTPEYRWNPLKVITIGKCPPRMRIGENCTFRFTIQNTGTATWKPWQPIYLGFHGWENKTRQKKVKLTAIPTTVAPGETVDLDINVTPPTNLNPGQTYTLRFEMGMETSPDYTWEGFSALEPGRPWFTYNTSTYIITYTGTSLLYLPLIKNGSSGFAGKNSI